ncbi:MAG: hypothetical protein IKJ27_07980 [Clostridia bacterium]|nr:hypothetical protein [Clostridia bacterium]
MTYELYRYIFIGGLALSVLMLVLAVVMFFTMDIRRLVGEYNGTTKRKAIEKIRKKSSGEATTSGDISKYAPVKAAPSKSKPAPSKSKAASKKSKPAEDYASAETSKIRPQDRYDSFAAPETTALSDYDTQQNGYAVQAQYEAQQIQYPYVYRDDFIIETDITYIHSAEVIR